MQNLRLRSMALIVLGRQFKEEEEEEEEEGDTKLVDVSSDFNN
jgi:hypothetical protein